VDNFKGVFNNAELQHIPNSSQGKHHHQQQSSSSVK
jgi:hypothetical protein